MKTASTILLIAAGAAVLAAIWTPVGSWWQWAITALVLLLAGAAISGNDARRTRDYDPITGRADDELLPEHVAEELVDPATREQLDADVAAYKRTYGRKADQ